MIFEGSEKKAEIIINPNEIDLFDLSKSFWQELVSKSNATILSHIRNKNVLAFLLSESSLFIWRDRILLITCGQTTLISAIDFFIDAIGQDNIEQLIFQRKNEYYSHLQPTSFFDDIKRLQRRFTGSAYRMGAMDGHHNFIFHLDHPYSPLADDHTYELLMYDISSSASALLTKPDLTCEEVRTFLKLDSILDDFIIDDFLFKPFGYSMNAVSDNKYFTIHITPQEQGSYISFETDINLKEHVESLVKTFSPGSFDFIEFIPAHDAPMSSESISNYAQNSNVVQELSCGYTMQFSQYNKLKTKQTKAFKFK